jgi:hypothetical protein
LATFDGVIRRVRKAVGIKENPALDPRLSTMERVFHAPPMTPELAAAIRLISPHFENVSRGTFHTVWEADQNGACWGEFEALEGELSRLPRPAKILEVGPGMGRSLVFFSKKLGWDADTLHAYEGDGDSTKYTILGPRFEDSFCGNIPILREVLDFNGVRNVTVFNASELKLADLPGPYDLIYSFYCIGFHWSLEYFLLDILSLMHNRSVAIFTVPIEFEAPAGLADLQYKIIEWKTAWPKDGHLKFVILSGVGVTR